jgi:hypothetical protein
MMVARQFIAWLRSLGPYGAKSRSTAPSGRVVCFDRHLGLKPQAESCSPFGTNKPSDARPHFRCHITPRFEDEDDDEDERGR